MTGLVGGLWPGPPGPPLKPALLTRPDITRPRPRPLRFGLKTETKSQDLASLLWR